MTESILFNLGLIFIVIHEMDAIRCKEWRIFPGLNQLSDKLGFTIFIFAHIPIFGFIFHNIVTNSASQNFIIYSEVFFIAHLLIHLVYLKHPNNLFKDYISWMFIIAPAVFGIIDLAINLL